MVQNHNWGAPVGLPPPSKKIVWAEIFLKNGGFVLSDIWDQNRPFSKFELTPRWSALWQRIQKSPKKWSKPESESESAPGRRHTNLGSPSLWKDLENARF